LPHGIYAAPPGEIDLRQRWLVPLLVIIAVAAVSYGIFRATRHPVVPEGLLYGNGHVEGTEVRVTSEVGGRITSQSLPEGGNVVQGQPVVVLESETTTDLLNAARAELRATRQSREAIDSQIAMWHHHVETAERQLSRIRDLRASNLASEADADQAENTLREAQQQVQSLGSQAGALDEQIAAAEARAQLAESNLEKHVVEAPIDGTVLVRTAETGEVIQPGQPLALIVDLTRLELKVYVPEKDIGKVRLGNPARVSVNAFPDRYFEAHVSRVDDYAQFTPRDIHVPEERTRMVYGVTLALDDASGQLKPGMPADAWIKWDDSASWTSCCPLP